MADYFDVTVFSLIGGVFSLLGGALLISRQRTALALAKYGTPFAAGALLAAAFFDLLPESLHALEAGTATRWVLFGIVAFFLLEHFLHWFHHTHHEEHAEDRKTAPLIIIGDTIHNFLDGIAIGAAFLISVPVGIVTAIAVAAHEIPQEIGDFGLLLKAGYSRNKVLVINGLSALMSTVGALLTFWLGSNAALPLGELLAVTAGFFIYIAASDIIPAIHEHKGRAANVGAALLVAAVLCVGVVTELAHDYIETDHAGENHNYPMATDQQAERYSAFYQPQECVKDGVEGIIAYDLYGNPLPKDTDEPLGCANLPLCHPEYTIEGDPANAPCFLSHSRH